MSASRTPFIAGNWKMHKTIAETEEFIAGFLPRVYAADGVDVALCVPFTALGALVDSTRGSRVQVFAQNMLQDASGAHNGEISSAILNDLDVHGVVLGHSERRADNGETDRALALKVPAAQDAGLLPILCVGETEAEREAGDTERKLRHQVQEGLEKVPTDRLGSWWWPTSRSGRSAPASSPRPSRPRTPAPSCARSWPPAPRRLRRRCASSTAGR